MPLTTAFRNRTVRTTLAVALALVVVTGSVGAFLITASEPASGQTTLSGLDVSDTQREIGPNGDLQAVRLTVSADYSYESTHELTKATVELYVRQPDGSYQTLDTLSLSDPGFNDSATVDLHGDVTDTSAFDMSDFDAQEGATTTQQIDVKVVIKLFRDGTRVGVADASDSAQVEVSRQELTVSASLAGEGSVSVDT